ncbi:alpha/beta fold hydrolase [Granulicella arctica]|uniref:alpha/beta fold hydrolase n=1 Tax=Granulicella arctica TaxID=940613 RepID=UPI0021E01117|nr:alpha/beta hydrolase [Granulicella arctica]
MSFLNTDDGTRIYFKDWGAGQPIVFCHGWPLSADAWDAQMLFFGSQGYRVIAHDRRSHGRSDQTWGGNDMDRYADDLAELLIKLDLKDSVLVGHSTGGGEVARYLGRHGSARVKKAVLIGAVPPVMVQSEGNPAGLPITVFDAMRAAVSNDRSQFFLDLSTPFYGFNVPGAKVSEGLKESFWLQGMLGGLKGEVDCIKQFSETDFTEDLRRIDVPVLVMHGGADQIVPIADSAELSDKLLKNSTLKIYPGFHHGMCQTHAEVINQDLLAFIES